MNYGRNGGLRQIEYLECSIEVRFGHSYLAKTVTTKSSEVS